MLPSPGAGSLVLKGTAASSMGNVNGGGTGTFQLLGSGLTTIAGNLNIAALVGASSKLALYSTDTGTAAVTMGNNAALTMNVLGAAQWSPTSLTLGTGCTLNFNGVTNSGTTTAAINAGSVTAGGPVTVNVNNTADPAITVGSSYPLLAHSGAASGYTLLTQPVGWIGHLELSGSTLVYKVDLQYDIWNNATLNSIWDMSSANWMGHATTYADPASVLFNDASVTSNQVITVNGVVSPSAIVGGSSTYNYEIDSTAGNYIAGSASVTMLGSKNLTFVGGVNTFSGATVINAGTVTAGVLANNNAPSDLGQPNTTDASKLVINGGTLNYMGGNVAIDRGVTIGANNGTIGVSNSASTLTMNGLITGPGMFTLSGNGTMVLPNANTHSGGTTIGASSTMKIGTLAAFGTSTNINLNGTLDVNGLALPNADLVTFGNNSTLANSGASVTNDMQSYVAGNYHITLAGTANMTFNWLNGSGYPNWNTTNNITGTVDLAGTNDNSGMLYFQNSAGTTLLDKTNATGGAGSANSANVYNGLVREAGSQQHQLYSGGTILINGPGVFDMNGNNEMVGSLQSTALGGTLENSKAATVSTLALTGGATYTGTITDGAGKIAIVETNGGGTEYLAGTNSFTGGITTYAGNLNYGGYWYNNDPIMNYGVKITGGTATFNIGGTYYWNYATISGNGIFAMNNTNMVMWMTNDMPINGLFTGPVTVTLGRLHLVGNENYYPAVMSTITVGNNTNAILEVHDTSPAPASISGSLALSANSQLQFDYDYSGNVFQVVSNVTASGAIITVNVVGSPMGKGTYTLMTYNGTLTGNFASIPVITGAGLSGLYDTYITSGNGAVKLVVLNSYKWISSTSGNWSTVANWSAQPNAPGEVATLGAGTSLTTVTLDQPYSIGGLLFNNANSFIVSGSQNMTLDNGGGGASISAIAGTANAINVPVVLNDNLGASIGSGSVVTMSGILSGSYALTMNGGGTLVLSGINTYSGGTTVGGGTLKLGNGSALGTNPTNNISTGGILDLNGQTLAYGATSTATNTINMLTGAYLGNSSANTAYVHSTILSPASISWTIQGTGPITLDNVTGPGYPNWYITNLNTGTITLTGTNDITGGIPVNRAGTLLLQVTNTTSSPAEIHAASSLIVLGGLVKYTGTGGGQVWTGGTITLGGGTLDMNGNGQRIGTFTSGGITNTVGVLTNSLTATMSTLTNNGGVFYGTVGGNLTLTYTAAATLGGINKFWGGLNVTAGTLVVSNALTTANTLSTNLPVDIASSSVLNLLLNVTNQVKSLVLGGVAQPAGLYNSSTATGYITGPGALLIAAGGGPSGPATLTNSITGSTLTLKWPAGQSWRLVSQTNSLSTGLNPSSAAWTTVSGVSDGSATITINPANPTVYYKLVYP